MLALCNASEKGASKGSGRVFSHVYSANCFGVMSCCAKWRVAFAESPFLRMQVLESFSRAPGLRVAMKQTLPFSPNLRPSEALATPPGVASAPVASATTGGRDV